MVYLIVLGLVFQIVCIIIAFWLLTFTKTKKTWLFVIVALIIMATRRAYHLIIAINHPEYTIELTDEIFATSISFIMMLGMIFLTPLFKYFKKTSILIEQEKSKADSYLNIARVLFVALDRAGNIKMANHKCCELLGYEEKELIGKNLFELIFNKKESEHLKNIHFENLTNETSPYQYHENEIISRTGERRLIAWNNVVIKNDKGIVTGSLCSGEDITEKKIAEQALKDSNERLEEAQKTAKIGNWEANLITGELYWSEEIFNIFGFDSKSFKPSVSAFYDAVYPDDREKVLKSETLSEQTGLHDVEHRIILPNNEIRFVHELAKRYSDNEGNLIMLRGTVQDITELKKAEYNSSKACQTQTIINNIINISLENDSLEIILEKFLYKVLEIDWLNIESKGGIWLVDNNKKELKLIANKGLSDEIRSICSTIPFGKCICGKVAENNSIIFSDCINEIHEVNCCSINPHGHYCLPISKDNKVFGVINLYIKEGHEYDDKEVEFLNSIVKVLSLFIERKLADDELKESEEKFRNIYENTSIGIYRSTPSGKILLANPALIKILEYSSFEELSQRDLSQNGFEQDHTREQFIQLMAKEGEVKNLESAWISKKGSVIFINENAKAVYNQNGEIIYYEGSVENITVRKQAEKALLKSEKKFRDIINISPVPLALNDEQQNINFLNPAFIQMFGYTLDDIPTIAYWWLLAYPDLDYRKWVVESWQAELEKVKQTGAEFTPMEYTVKCKNGTNKTVLISASSISNSFDDNHLVVFYDITERKLSEEEIKIAKYKAENYLNLVEVMLIALDNNANILLVNRKGCNLLGYKEEELLGKNWFELIIAPEDYERVFYVFKKIISGNYDVVEYFENDIVTKNGDKRYIAWHNTVLKDNYGNITGLLTSGEDITERKQFEEELRKTNSFFDSIITNIPNMVFIKEAKDLRFVSFNKAGEELLGISKDELIGKNDYDFFPKEQADFFTNKDRDVLNQTEIYNIAEEPINTKNKGTRILHTKKVPLFNALGEPEYLLGISEDITELKHAEEELIKAKERAEESDKLKSAFLANMSHEIRTPMNGILGFTELLKQPELTGEKQQEFIGIIEKSGTRLLNIINDIINISKIESGQISINLTETNINEQIEFIYNFFNPEVKQKGLELIFKNSLTYNKAIIKTDKEKVYAVLTNLVKNAIKFTNNGTIEFGYIAKDNFLEFYIKDTGIGIPKDRQKAVFERFIQADIQDKTAIQGAGLGLAISKAYIEMLGGKIWIESDEGKGSAFYFTLPYKRKVKTIEKNVVLINNDMNQIKNLTVLIAEDDETSEVYVTTIIKKYSKEIINVRTGTEVVDICRNNSDIDLIMMDVQMPEQNGYEATKQIRQFNKDVIIIAQTAYALSGDREKALEAGCNDYIAKPFSPTLLDEILKKHFKKE